MAKYSTADIRNIALVGHGDSGKTTLADAMLFKAKEVKRRGTVEEGTSIFDYDEEERHRRNSIDLAIASASYAGKHVNIVDAPGYPDFAGEAHSAIAPADTVLLCINAASGIMVNTRKMWDVAKEEGKPIVIVITKIDHENIDFPKLMAEIRENFGNSCATLFLPDGLGPSVKAVHNILLKRDPADETLRQFASQAVEKLTELDDALLERYLDGKEIGADEMAAPLGRGLAESRIVPILCVSSVKDVGVAETLDIIARFCPSPLDVRPRHATDPETKADILRKPLPTEPFGGFVFKSISDPFLGKLSYIRICSGGFTNDHSLFNQRTGKGERIGGLFKPFGKEQRAIPDVVPGDIVGVTKAEDLQTCDTVCAPTALVKYDPIRFPIPMVSLAAEPKSKADEQRLTSSLHKMADSDPTFKVSRDRQTVELVITGMSQLHIDIVLARLKRRYEVELVTHQPKIPYLETINGSSDGHHKHKKQTGGRGQYAEVYIKLDPSPRGEGFKFLNKISQGRIPNQYVPAVEKGIKELLEKGVIAGCHVVDVQVTVYDGSYHDVDSSEAAFKIAASKAFKAAFKNARPVLLEPIVNLEVTIPSTFMGDITADLNTRRGRIQGMDTRGNLQVIKAVIPLAEVITYSTDLRSMTGGEGSYAIEQSHHDIVPQRVAESIMAKAAVKEEKEED